jgi:tRNA 5-methylaminomethyl-2-thiouridine biosynthesis bifunctional protein
VNTVPIVPAQIVVDDDGTPRSIAYGDVYHPRSGALAQARHVFLGDDALALQWRGRERFVILETGFGLGNNFLATWAAWRDDHERCRNLHFVAVEESPPTRAAIAAAARDRSLAPLAAELAAHWPPLTCNLHRLAFDDAAVELLLAFGSASAWLPQLAAEVDAFFLDGFAPARNPAMWEPRVFKAMARLAAPGATVATWSAARAVRDGLAGAGFEVERAPGSGGKRDITRGRFAPRFQPRPAPRRLASHAMPGAGTVAPSLDDAGVIVVGAGVAGCALTNALARRGVRALVLERKAEIASEASGNAAAIFHGVVHRRDGRHARFHRAAAFAAAAAVRGAIDRHGVTGSSDGLLRIETRLDIEAMRAIVVAQGLPDDYVVALDAAAAGRIAGIRLGSPAWHYPGGGWVDPRALASAWLADAGDKAQLRLGCAVGTLRREDGRWLVGDADGTLIARALSVVLCDGNGGAALLGADAWPIRCQRGQIDTIAADALGVVPNVPIAGHGHVVHARPEAVWFGTSTAWDDGDQALRPSDRQRNLDRLAVLLSLPAPPQDDRARGRVGFRWVSDDRLPIVGAVPAALAAGRLPGCPAAAAGRLDQPRFIARTPGLFVLAALGSRGIAAAALGAEIVSATIAGAPVAAEADLLDAVDPARFLSRRFRRGAAATGNAESGDQPPLGPIAGVSGA